MDIKEFQAKLNEVYRLVSMLTVRGDAVDIVAEARLLLRELRGGLTKLESAVTVAPGIPTTAVAEPCAKEAVGNGGQDDRGA